MPKSKKSKAKHQDFQKVKLKVGKKLPKGLNETKAIFKSSGLHVKEQFKDDVNQASSTKRRLVISEILAHLQHYNAGMKHDALQGLKELINADPTVLHTHLPLILERLSGLFVDKDSVIRSTVIKLLKSLFPRISSTQISPFFPVISAHICCAMTHILDEIQFDSLPLLDLCLEHYPSHVISSTSQLMPNFIEQISHQSQTRKGVKAGERSLSVNPNSKHSSKKWRIHVLERLTKLLKALPDYQSRRVRTSSLCSTKTNIISVDYDSNSLCTVFNPTVPTIQGFTLRNNGGSVEISEDLLGDPAKFKSYFQIIVPLLIECWVEAGPAQMSVAQKAGNVLSAEALQTLQSVLGVIQLLILCVHGHMEENNVITTDWIKTAYMSEFVHYFMAYFPYSMTQKGGSNYKQNQKFEAISVVSINLALCDVMSYFWNESDDSVVKSKWFGWIITYVSQQLSGDNKLAHKDLLCIISILRKATAITSQQDVVSQILSSATALYQTKHPASGDALTLLDFYVSLITDRQKRKYLMSLPCMTWWLEALPKHAVKIGKQNEAATSAIYSAMSCLATQREEVFLNSLQENFADLLDLRYVEKLSPSTQGQLVELVQWIPVVGQDIIGKLCQICHGTALTLENVLRLLEILKIRVSNGSSVGSLQLQDLINFLMSIVVGYTKSELDDMKTSDVSGRFVVITDKEKNRAACQQAIRPAARLMMKQLLNKDQMWTVLNPFVENVMTNWQCLPVTTCIGLMAIICDCCPRRSSNTQASICSLSARWAYSVLLGHNTKTLTMEADSKHDNVGAIERDETSNGDDGDLQELYNKYLTCGSEFLSSFLDVFEENLNAAEADERKKHLTVMNWVLKCIGSVTSITMSARLTRIYERIQESDAQIFGQALAAFKLHLNDIDVLRKSQMPGDHMDTT